jgi:DNA-binding NarL/FixJ family response regulator
VDTGALVGPRIRPAVLVLGAGGLTRRLVVDPLRDHGVVVFEAGESPPPDHRAVVGLLVNPSNEQWAAATAERLPLVLVVLDRLSDEEVVDLVLRGADAVVTAHDEVHELIRAVELVADGGTVLAPRHVRALADTARSRRFDTLTSDALTRRELDILRSIDRGETVKQTARALGISAKTVENLQSRLFRKLGVRNRAQAVSRAHALAMLAAEVPLLTGDGQGAPGEIPHAG